MNIILSPLDMHDILKTI